MRARAACLLLLLAAPAGAQLLVPEPELPPGAAAKWDRDQVAIDTAVAAAKWTPAESGATKLLDEMVARLAHGRGAEPRFASALLARAVARAGRGETREAAWDFAMAHAFDPALAPAALAARGAAGERLAAAVAAEEAVAAAAVHACTGSDCTGDTLPKDLERHEPVSPKGGVERCSPGFYLAVAAIGVDGRLHRPVLDAVREPALAYLVLETLRRDRFAPATSGGQPVVVVQSFEIHFRLPPCEGSR